MPIERIRNLFWTAALEETHGECMNPPMALRRTYAGIKSFWRLGNKHKRQEIEKWGGFDDELRDEFEYCEH